MDHPHERCRKGASGDFAGHFQIHSFGKLVAVLRAFVVESLHGGRTRSLDRQNGVDAEILLQQHSVRSNLHLHARIGIRPVHRCLGLHVLHQFREDAAAVGFVGDADHVDDLRVVFLDEGITCLFRRGVERIDLHTQCADLLIGQIGIPLNAQQLPVVTNQPPAAGGRGLAGLRQDANLRELRWFQDGRVDEGTEVEMVRILRFQLRSAGDQVMAGRFQGFFQ